MTRPRNPMPMRADRALPHGEQDGDPLCASCGLSVDADEPRFQIRGVVVHMRCAPYRRRRLTRAATPG